MPTPRAHKFCDTQPTTSLALLSIQLIIPPMIPGNAGNCKFSIPFQQHTIWPFLWCVHFAAHKICTMLLTL